MSQLILLEQTHHQNLKIDPERRAEHAADQRLMPVVVSEFQSCAIHFPLVITKNADSGAFLAAALFGFDEGENLFWREGRWDALYSPLNVQRQPFFVGNRDENMGSADSDFVLCFDAKSPCLTEADNGELLFESDGQPSAYLQQMQTTLGQLLAGESETARFIDKLIELDLLVPFSLDITFNNGQSHRVEGIYTVGEERLASLAADQVAALHAGGYLAIIYTMLVSLGQLYPLIERKNRMLEAAEGWFQAAEA